jgi:hypothetical protein
MENVFAANPKVNELLVFADGTCFVKNAAGENEAINYAKQTKQDYKLVTREVEKEEKPNKPNKPNK